VDLDGAFTRTARGAVRLARNEVRKIVATVDHPARMLWRETRTRFALCGVSGNDPERTLTTLAQLVPRHVLGGMTAPMIDGPVTSS